MMTETGFTKLYAIDCLDNTIPVDSIANDLKILDVAAGSGALSIPAAERVKQYNGSVIATDFSPEMIKIHNEIILKSQFQSLPIEAKVMDGQALKFDDNYFDFVYSVFGVIFFSDQLKGFREILRVLKPGGKTAITAWSDRSPLGAAIRETIVRLYADHPELIVPSPSRSVVSLSDPARFESYLRECGFRNVTIIPSTHYLKTNIKRYISFGKGNPVIENLKSNLHEIVKPKFDTTFEQVLFENYPDGELSLESLAYIGIAEK